LNSKPLIRRLVFWVASAVASVYWLLLGWRFERGLSDLVLGPLVAADDYLFALVAVGLTYALPPLIFASCVRLLRVRRGRRTWAIPATGLMLLWVFLGLESWILGVGAFDLIRVSIASDAGPAALAVALIGLIAGSAVSWRLLRVDASRPVYAAGSMGRVEQALPADSGSR
jgi:hypothetical protein